jgi:hypothetical protein
METEGELSFEYVVTAHTMPRRGQDNGLLFFVNGEFTDLPYYSKDPAESDSGDHQQPRWHAYSRFLPPGQTLLVWNYHQDDRAASQSSVRRSSPPPGAARE